jgi:hypothetical protein
LVFFLFFFFFVISPPLFFLFFPFWIRTHTNEPTSLRLFCLGRDACCEFLKIGPHGRQWVEY